MKTLVLTAIGDDQPGLVGAVASAVAALDASWEQSHMARMKGKFAGIVVVEVADDRADELVAALNEISHQGLLDLTIETVGEAHSTSAGASGGEQVELELIGPDQPGIVNELTALLAKRSVSIVEFESQVRDAPMGGGELFDAQLTVELPAGVDVGSLRFELEEVAAGLMVELTFGA